MQLLTVAILLASMATVGIIYAVADPAPGPKDEPYLSLAAACVLPVQTLIALVLPGFLCNLRFAALANEDPEHDIDRLFLLRQTTHIVALALIEGAVLLAAIAYLLELHPWTLLLSLAGIFLIALRFPTAAAVEAWIDLHERRLGELRAGRPLPD
jgi:hypothetical protein